ncbi:hypothetical protein Hamer_G023840 [Homarus americanus]|uniref:Uncharacterized protein n=1 Tax=Homarus americanus TaxID=6706 RepID=A0A8J5JFC4_HOMAM|nr:hypothetical protein Hamer_G023840 [Homarus americanus]
MSATPPHPPGPVTHLLTIQAPSVVSPVRGLPPPITITTIPPPIRRPFLDQLNGLLGMTSLPRPPAPPVISQPQYPVYTGHIGQGQHGQGHTPTAPNGDLNITVTTSAPSSFSVSVDVYVPILSEILGGRRTTTPIPAADDTHRPAVPQQTQTPAHVGLQSQDIQSLIEMGYTYGG